MGDLNSKWLLGKVMLESPGIYVSDSDRQVAVSLIQQAANERIPQAQHLLGLPVDMDLLVLFAFCSIKMDHRLLSLT